MNSAETLRRASALIRERAEAATPGSPRWETAPDEATASRRYIFPANSDSAITIAPVDDALHIASWHPAVAFAVADLLDIVEAWVTEYGNPDDSAGEMFYVTKYTLAVARAFLG